LRQIIGSESDKDNILDIFMREFFLLYREMQRGEFLGIADEYMLDLYRVNGYFPFEDSNGKFQAKVETVLPSGHLVLKTLENEERRYAFKEVTFLND